MLIEIFIIMFVVGYIIMFCAGVAAGIALEDIAEAYDYMIGRIRRTLERKNVAGKCMVILWHSFLLPFYLLAGIVGYGRIAIIAVRDLIDRATTKKEYR